MLIFFHLPQATNLAFTCSSCFEHSFKELLSVVFSILSSLSSVWTWALQVLSYWFYATLLNFLEHVLVFQSSVLILLISKPIKNILVLNESLPFLLFLIQKKKKKGFCCQNFLFFISLSFSLSLFLYILLFSSLWTMKNSYTFCKIYFPKVTITTWWYSTFLSFAFTKTILSWLHPPKVLVNSTSINRFSNG